MDLVEAFHQFREDAIGLETFRRVVVELGPEESCRQLVAWPFQEAVSASYTPLIVEIINASGERNIPIMDALYEELGTERMFQVLHTDLNASLSRGGKPVASVNAMQAAKVNLDDPDTLNCRTSRAVLGVMAAAFNRDQELASRYPTMHGFINRLAETRGGHNIHGGRSFLNYD